MDHLLPNKEPDPHSDGPDDKVPPDLHQLLPGDPHQVEPALVTTKQLSEYPSHQYNHVTSAHHRGAHGAFPLLLGSSISKISTILITVVRACLVLTTRQLGEAYPNSMAETLDRIGLSTCQIQTLSCGEDIIIVKYNLIYLIVKGDLEKEDSYGNDMHGLSYPSEHENDEADQPNNVVIYKDVEISTLFLKRE